jgi:hypothetical protein
MSFKNLERQTAHCIQPLQLYNFTSEHLQGQKHNIAHDLSRRPCREEYTHYYRVEARADVNQILAIAAIAGAGRNIADLRT